MKLNQIQIRVGLGVLVLGLIGLGALIKHYQSSIYKRQPLALAPAAVTSGDAWGANIGPVQVSGETRQARASTQAPPVVSVAPSPAGPAAPQDLVAQLWELGTHGSINTEQAEEFRKALAELVGQGAASVPAIREFLAKNLDIAYAEVPGADQLGYSSLRAGLIDALKQIGGTEAQMAMLETVQTTALPAELLELAKNLEELAPGLYREQIVAAAREALTMASASQLGSNVEVGPAFRMLQMFGEGNTIEEAARNDGPNFVNAVALANLPNGTGLPSLVDMAQKGADPSRQAVAVEMIAQLAGQNPQALETLAQMAQRGEIRNSVWEKLAPILGGDHYQLADPQTPAPDPTVPGKAGQNVAIINAVTTPDQANQRIAVIDRFLGLVGQDSAAAAALLRQRNLLSARFNN